MHLPPLECYSSMLPLRMLGLLMFMLRQCGAEDDCPLILDPPVIIREYGTNISLSCNSPRADLQEMFLWIGNTSIASSDVRNNVSHRWPLTDWDINAECRIKLNDSFECKEKAEIIVYQNPKVFLFTTVVNGSVEKTQYEVQCEVINVAPVQNLTVTWYKNDEVIHTNSFSEATKVPVKKYLSLMVNVSRGENVVQLSCEARLNLSPQGPQHPVISEIHNVSAFYAPEVRTNIRGDIIVSEGGNVTLTCDVEGNPTPDFKWTFDGVNMSENTNKLDVTQGYNSTNYTCTATNVLGKVTMTFHVQVAEQTTNQIPVTTPKPGKQRDCDLILTPSEIVVKFGDPAAINCNTSYEDVLLLGWESPVNPIAVNRTSVLWKVDKVVNWTWKMLCFATFDDNQCSASPTITIYKTPDVVSVSAVGANPMIEGREYRLKCNILNVAPVKNLTIKWYQGDEVFFTEQPKNTTAFPLDLFSILTVTPQRSDNGSVFRCEADLVLKPTEPDFNLSTFSSPYTAVVQYKPFFKACLDHYSVKEDEFSMNKLSCETDGNPPPTVNWYYQGKLIDSNELLSRNHSGNYTAEVTNSIGKSWTSFFITVEYGPSFSCDKQYEVDVNTEGRVPCEPEGLPPPSITWFKNGKKIASPQRWAQEDSGNYFLRAENTHGTVEHMLHIDVQYPPTFKDGNISMDVIPGENVTLECSAQGNPSPDVEWKYPLAGSLEGPAKGRQKIIITVTAATSTNASPYMCVATNKVGTVTRFVSLVEKDFNRETFNKLWLLLLLVPVVVLIVYYLHKNEKKQGRYSFVTNTDIPLTTTSA